MIFCVTGRHVYCLIWTTEPLYLMEERQIADRNDFDPVAWFYAGNQVVDETTNYLRKPMTFDLQSIETILQRLKPLSHFMFIFYACRQKNKHL